MKMFFSLEEKNSRRTGSSYHKQIIEDKRIDLFESQYLKSLKRPTHMTIRLLPTLSPDFREKTCGNRMPTPHSCLLPLIMPG